MINNSNIDKICEDTSNTAAPLQVACFMSGYGSNVTNLIKHEEELIEEGIKPLYHVAAIFSDNIHSNAEFIGQLHNIPVIVNDMVEFYRQKSIDRKEHIRISDMAVREEFDALTARSLKTLEKEKLGGLPIGVIAYAGYKHLVTSPILNYNQGSKIGISIYPADPEVISAEDLKRYSGDDYLKKFILEDIHTGQKKYMRSMTHIVEKKINSGRILIVSRPVEVLFDKNFDRDNPKDIQNAIYSNTDRLKENGDREIFTRTIEDYALNRFLIYSDGQLYYSTTPEMAESYIHIPKGLRLENPVPVESQR